MIEQVIVPTQIMQILLILGNDMVEYFLIYHINKEIYIKVYPNFGCQN